MLTEVNSKRVLQSRRNCCRLQSRQTSYETTEWQLLTSHAKGISWSADSSRTPPLLMPTRACRWLRLCANNARMWNIRAEGCFEQERLGVGQCQEGFPYYSIHPMMIPRNETKLTCTNRPEMRGEQCAICNAKLLPSLARFEHNIMQGEGLNLTLSAQQSHTAHPRIVNRAS